MSWHLRITVPIIIALLCSGAMGMALIGELRTTRSEIETAIQAQNKPTPTDATVPTVPSALLETGDDALTHLRRGDIFAMRGFWKEALDEYRAAVEGGAGIIAIRKLATASVNTGDLAGARNAIDRLRAEGSRTEEIFLLEGIVALRTGDTKRLGELLQGASDSPQRAYLSGLLALKNDMDTNRDDYALAKRELTKARDGWDPVIRSNAETLLGAFAEYAQFPESPSFHLDTLLARALGAVQECEIAIPFATRATLAQADYRDAWIVRGYCELTTQRTKEAIDSLEHAYELDPEKPETQYFLGRAYGASGDHAQATTYLSYAVENGFEPIAEARMLLAREALLAGKSTLALAQYEALMNGQDATMDAYRGYIAAALALRENERALLQARKATERWPTRAEAFDLLGIAAEASGRKEDALQAFTRAMELNPSLSGLKERLEKVKGD